MALSCGMAVHLESKQLSMHTHDFREVTKSSIFLRKKPSFFHIAVKNVRVSSTASLTTPSADDMVEIPPQPPSVDGSTMSVVLAPGLEPATISIPTHVKRSDFPPGFIFGASSSAFQTEGNGKEGGRAPSTWDSMISSGGNQMAIDSYSLYKVHKFTA
uniref:Uncharacterized protein n=1 Tax=Chenopodium quinoa TaxID=63459 RepID=A0A803N6V8_CHEQI